MSTSYGPIVDTSLKKVKVFTVNLAQAAGTYTLATCNATGGVLIHDVQIYCTVSGATFTSAAIATNDTTPVTIMSSVEGGVANITSGKNIAKAFTGPTYLHTSKLIQLAMVGTTGTGTCLMIVHYTPTVSGADIA